MFILRDTFNIAIPAFVGMTQFLYGYTNSSTAVHIESKN